MGFSWFFIPVLALTLLHPSRVLRMRGTEELEELVAEVDVVVSEVVVTLLVTEEVVSVVVDCQER